MFCNAATMSCNLTRLSLPRARTLFKSRSHHFLAPKRKTCSQFKSQHFKCLYSSLKGNSADVSEMDDFETESRSPYENIDFAEIAGDDPDRIRALKRIQLELDMMRQQGERVPTELTTRQWRDILELDSAHKRTRIYHFFWLNEHKKRTNKEKRLEKRENFLDRKAAEPFKPDEITTSGPIIYRLDLNSLFFRLYDAYMKQRYNLRLLYASMFNPHILIDCGYEPYMTAQNMQNCTKQMLLMWSENREHYNPFHLVFCNLSPESVMFDKLSRRLVGSEEPDFPFFHTSKHYLDLYPKERLVYLTPHCTEELKCYHPDDIYIIGGFVDKSQCEPLSLAKAKKEGIRMAKFPLDKYLKWQRGIKSLTLNQCLAIMNDLKDDNDWKRALRHVPSRKIRSEGVNFPDEEDLEMTKTSLRGSARLIREQYRHNLVYDLLMKDLRAKKDADNSLSKSKPPPKKKW